MADTKTTALTADASPTSDDLFMMVDDPAGSPVNKKVAFSAVEAALAVANMSDASNYALLSSLASTSNALGASLIGVEDSAGRTSQTTVEGYLDENRAAIDALEAAGYIANVSEDATPTLGGPLDGDGNDLNNLGVIFLTEQAAAEADVAGKAQIWAKNDTPNTLYFTNDAGTDAQLVTAGGAFHDGFSDFVSNEHVDHSSVSITGGNGLTGGGDITASRSLAVGAGTGITVNANDIEVNQSALTLSNMIGYSSLAQAGGDVYTGTHDFGGADDLEIPNGTAPTVDTAGQIALDTNGVSPVTHGVMLGHDGTNALYFWPTTNAPSSDNDVPAYDSGTNSIIWQAQSGAGGGISNVVEDTTPQLGGMLDVNGQSLGDGTLELLKFTETASAVNEITVANAATGNGPTISATGDDTNIDLNLSAKGSGVVNAGGNRILTTADEGTGNGLDADTLDGNEGAAYALLSVLASTSNGDGASLIALEDAGTLFATDNVEAALAEVMGDVNAIEADYLTSSDIGSTIQGFDAGLAYLDGLSFTNEATFKAAVNLEAGTDFYSVSGADATFQPLDADLTAIAGLSSADGNFIVGSATGWVAESGATARASLDVLSATDLASTANAKGASLIGVEDSGTYWTATTVEGVLAEIGAADYLTSISGLAPDTATTAAAQPNITSLGTLTALQVDNINVNGNAITSTDANGSITITPNGTGDIVLDGLKWPQADGTADYVLKTDGAGQLSWVAQGAGGGDAWSDPINSSITVDTDNTYDLATGAATLKDIHARTINAGTAASDTLKIRGYDVDGTAYVDYLTVTSGNSPTANLNTAVTIDSKKILRATSPTDGAVPYFSGTDGTLTRYSGFAFAQATGLDAELFDSGTTNVGYAVTSRHATSGTAAAGFGSGYDAQAENAAGEMRQIGAIEWAWTDATDTSEDSDIKLYGYTAGSKTEYMHLDGANQLVDLPTGWQFAINGTPISTGGLGNVVEDTTPQLGGDLDLNTHVITGMVIGTDIQAYDAGLAWLDSLNFTNESTFKAAVNLEIGTDVQAYDADLDTWATLTPSANAQSLVTAADYAAMRALLDLEAGTDFYSISAADAAFQPLDADLTTWAGITPGTGVGTALAVNVGSAGAFVTNGGALGTPSSGTLTNATGLPVSTGISGLGTGVATMLATPSAANFNSALSDGTFLFADDADQTITGGANVTVLSSGTKSSGTYTMDFGARPLQYIVNGGAFTLAPDGSNGNCVLLITNNASAGAITTSGWTMVTGDAFDTTNTNQFMCYCVSHNDGTSDITHLHVTAMQ